MKKVILFVFFIFPFQSFSSIPFEGEISPSQSLSTYYRGVRSLCKFLSEYKERDSAKYVNFLHEMALEAVRIKKVVLDNHLFLPQTYKDQLSISLQICLNLLCQNQLAEAANTIRQAKEALDIFFAKVFWALEEKQQNQENPLPADLSAEHIPPHAKIHTGLTTLRKELSDSHGISLMPTLLLPSLLLMFLTEDEDVRVITPPFPAHSSY